MLALIPAGAVGWFALSHASAGRRVKPSEGVAALARATPVAVATTQSSEEAERRRIVHEIVVCQGHLHAIGQGLLHWAERHGGKYPPDLGALVRDKAGGFSIGMFVCPGTGTKPPGNLTRDQQAAWVNVHWIMFTSVMA